MCIGDFKEGIYDFYANRDDKEEFETRLQVQCVQLEEFQDLKQATYNISLHTERDRRENQIVLQFSRMYFSETKTGCNFEMKNNL